MAKRQTTVKQTDVPQTKSVRTKAAILRHAVDIASVDGLEGLTIGRLAEVLDMSKSGLFAHFGSKQELQLETIEAARQIFIDEIMRPALTKPEGMLRLWALCDGWLSHIERKVFPGGCFFTAASFEFDSRKGPVRDRIAEIMRQWVGVLTTAVEAAQKAGQADPKVNASDLAFEMHALEMGAYWTFQLLDDKNSFQENASFHIAKAALSGDEEMPETAKGKIDARDFTIQR